MKKKRKFYTYSSPLTLKQIEWLRSYPDPPAQLRALIDTAIANTVEAKKQKLKELWDMWRLLGDAAQVQDEKRKAEYTKRIQAVMKQIEALKEEIG